MDSLRVEDVFARALAQEDDPVRRKFKYDLAASVMRAARYRNPAVNAAMCWVLETAWYDRRLLNLVPGRGAELARRWERRLETYSAEERAAFMVESMRAEEMDPFVAGPTAFSP